MKIKVVLEHHGIMPERAHEDDAGLDLFTPVDFFVGGNQRFTVWTGVRMELPEGTCGLIRSKSGLLKNKGIITDGVIDVGYTGQIAVTLINTTPRKVFFERGDKIAQMVITPVTFAELERAEELKDTERGARGFGSTGAKSFGRQI